MQRLAALISLPLLSCSVEPPPRAVAGLSAHLRSTKSAYILWEQIAFEFEVRNEGQAPVGFVPVHGWDRAYAWHRSTFDASEAMLVVEARHAPPSKEATAAGG